LIYSTVSGIKNGKGVSHLYELREKEKAKLVIDHATGLMWQQSGSKEDMSHRRAQKCIYDLNRRSFAGYNDWRLPTLEEAMSLMEPKKHADFYIDPIFDFAQKWIWTADKKSAGEAWIVNFCNGICDDWSPDWNDDSYVRAVRGEQLHI